MALLDIDPQGSLTIWYRLRVAAYKLRAAAPKLQVAEQTALRRAESKREPGFASVSGWRLAAELEKLRRNHDIVLIDTPPVIDSDARRAIRAADLVLIPLNPSPPDL